MQLNACSDIRGTQKAMLKKYKNYQLEVLNWLKQFVKNTTEQ
jgi:hypothetical protein